MGWNEGLWRGAWNQRSGSYHLWWRGRTNLDGLGGGGVGWQRTFWKVWKVVKLVRACSVMRGWLVVNSCWSRWVVDYSMRLWGWWMVRLNSRKVTRLKAWWVCWEVSKYLRLWLGWMVKWRDWWVAWLGEWQPTPSS